MAKASIPLPEGHVYAVDLPCVGEGGRSFHQTTIPLDHPCFDLPPAPISALVGFPVVVYRTQKHPASTPNHYLDNQIATFVMIALHDGFAPAPWQSRVGSCIVARKDKKPLDVKQFEVVWMYNDRILDYMGDVGSMDSLRAQGMMTKADFQKFFKRYSESQLDNEFCYEAPPPLFA